jgi:hypothetical protein
MPYTKTIWTDEIPASTPVKYKMTDDVLGEVAGSAKIEVVTSVTAGTQLNAANLNKVEDALEDVTDTADEAKATADAAFALANPVLVAIKTSSQSIADITYTDIAGWNSAIILAMGVTFNATTGEITLPSGKYILRILCNWAGNATGVRENMLKGGSGAIGLYRNATLSPGASVVGSSFLDVYFPVATTKVTAMQAWQNSGGALNLERALLQVIRIGD